MQHLQLIFKVEMRLFVLSAQYLSLFETSNDQRGSHIIILTFCIGGRSFFKSFALLPLFYSEAFYSHLFMTQLKPIITSPLFSYSA